MLHVNSLICFVILPLAMFLRKSYCIDQTIPMSSENNTDSLLSPGQTDLTFHLTFVKQMLDEMLGLFGHLVRSHKICWTMFDEV